VTFIVSHIIVSDFKNHKFFHTIGKPYVCEACDKRFLCESVLKQHTLTVLTHVGEKPHKYNICDQSFF